MVYLGNGKYSISFNEYDNLVQMAENVETVYFDSSMHDLKKKFNRRFDYPSIEDLKRHEVEKNLSRYLPYLVYYESVFQCDEKNRKDFNKVRAYIRNIINTHLEFV